MLHAMDVVDNIDRPAKRQKLEACSSTDAVVCDFDALPLPVLLLSLSNIMLHPPTHRHYAKSIHLSFLAAMKCISFRSLDPAMECRAWTTLAELGFRLGLENPEVESQVETAITKAVSSDGFHMKTTYL